MRRAKRLLLTILAALLCTPAAAAQDAADGADNVCRNGLFTDEQAGFRLARAAGRRGARLYFHGDSDGCPQAGARCRERSYVVAGDEVIVSKSLGGWVCAWYQPARGSETVGWLRADGLGFVDPGPAPALESWLGAWRFYENTLRVRRGKEPGTLAVEGDALWRGLGDNVHVGSVGAEARPAGNELTLAEEECRVVLRLVGRHLVADDNMRCGGFNVSFSGVYRRPEPRARRAR